MANSTLKKVALYTLGAFSGALLTIGVQGFAASEGKKQDALPVQSIRTLAEVYSQIKANYYEDKTDDVLLEKRCERHGGRSRPAFRIHEQKRLCRPEGKHQR